MHKIHLAAPPPLTPALDERIRSSPSERQQKGHSL